MDALVLLPIRIFDRGRPKTDSWFQALNAQEQKKKRTKSITGYTQTIDHMLISSSHEDVQWGSKVF